MTETELAQNYGECLRDLELEQEYGRAYTPQELGKLVNLDPRTVIKYHERWGGVEVAPGKWRFFDKGIKEVLNAKQGFEKRHGKIQGERDSSGTDTSKTVSGREQKVASGRSGMGKGNKKAIGTEAIPDPYGIFGNRPMVE
jgi:hypothetical protein